MNVVMTGSASGPLDWQDRIHNKPRREALANRFRHPKDPFRLVKVRNMWLTGFDAPSLHTMYFGKPRGAWTDAGNRAGQQGVLGQAGRSPRRLSRSGAEAETGAGELYRKRRIGTDRARPSGALMLEKHEVCCALFHEFDWLTWTTGTPQEPWAEMGANAVHRQRPVPHVFLPEFFHLDFERDMPELVAGTQLQKFLPLYRGNWLAPERLAEQVSFAQKPPFPTRLQTH